MTALLLNLNPVVELTDEQFYQLCQVNRDLKFERTSQGEILIVSLTGGETGKRNAELIFQLQAWSRQTNLGVVFDSSTGFKFPNSAIRSPDAAWIRRERWDGLTSQQKRKLVPLCPDFLVELCSPRDDIEEVQEKMQEYLVNGIRLGWLIEPETRLIKIYRPQYPIEILENPRVVSGEPVLPGFVLELLTIFEN